MLSEIQGVFAVIFLSVREKNVLLENDCMVLLCCTLKWDIVDYK